MILIIASASLDAHENGINTFESLRTVSGIESSRKSLAVIILNDTVLVWN